MADSASIPASPPRIEVATAPPRHSILVRLTHWITTLCFFALLITGMEIVVSHPRFYWGETGNSLTRPLFKIPIPSSRSTVPSGYHYTLPDQNGWSRALHFQSAWILVLTGLLYVASGLLSGHLRRDLVPAKPQRSWQAVTTTLRDHLRFQRPAETGTYNLLQRLAYLSVVFLLVPMAIWTGLAMSPAFVSAFPSTVTLLGGQQTARTLHFILSLTLTLFVTGHVLMVALSGCKARLRAMLTGTPAKEEDR
jgi:thiosulfate reductase cytochrome b subunit